MDQLARLDAVAQLQSILPLGHQPAGGQVRSHSASGRTTALSFALWLKKTSNLKSLPIPTSADRGNPAAFVGQKQNQSRETG
jgi:hypothetical protein